jgi:phosphoglycolate phosphatase
VSREAATALAVFDLDGTLIDSRRDLADSANEMLAGYGAPSLPEAAIVAMVGCGAATLVQRVIRASGVGAPIDEALERFLAAYDARLTSHTRPYDGVPAALDELRAGGLAMAMLTNKPLEQTVKILASFDLAKYFPWIVGGDGPLPRKPAPDGMRFLMAQASAGPEQTMLVGDSTVDLETSRHAGVRFCLARYGFGFRDAAPDTLRGDELLVDSPAELAGALLYARR